MDSHIVTIPNALSSTVCQNLIDAFEKSIDLQSPGMAGGFQGTVAEMPHIKKSTDIRIDQSFLNNELWGQPIQETIKVLNQGIEEYKKQYPFVNTLAPWTLDLQWNVQRYLPGEGFKKWHCETNSKRYNHRVLAWMIYLNTVTDGGGTEFAHGNETASAEEGKLVIWPGAFTHFHRGVVSPTETKYIATGWYIFYTDD